ncbi:helix-turn-helix domain-containing protein [Dechloromonas sp. HYN0024]|uniref:helix-turn-helix domain-containing protein n=1 Tax=Dechloromonas sp. HYN0024 TaxID=2231055 RepID=UPI0019670F0C|nr:helix-turn-helix transcriptional regulator [Dechloromonas sp. HYN0024]
MPAEITLRQILGENLKRLRAEREWSQEELAYQAQLHRTFVAHVERCQRNISLDNIEKLAQAFQIPAFQLLTPMFPGESRLTD